MTPNRRHDAWLSRADAGPGWSRPPGPTGSRGTVTALLVALLTAAVLQPAAAQKLRNGGVIVNTGTIAVRDSVIGLPPSIGGLIALTGPNQLVPARSYQNLSLTSPAVTTKWAQGNMFVSETLLIGPNVTFSVPADSVITLGTPSGRLTEQGYIAGKISKTVDLQGSTPSSDFGGIGVSIAWNGAAPGSTEVTRTSGSSIPVGGNSSIQRFYDITTANPTARTSLDFTYTTDELVGQNPASLDVWRLPPGQTRWRRQRTTRAGNTVSVANLQGYGRFTSSDGLNPLDSVLTYEWEPALFASLSADSVRGVRSQLLDSLFTVRVTDGFDQPISGVSVQFSISQLPAGATGAFLTVASGTTDANGVVSTRLALGDLSGRYVVTATTPAEPGLPPKSFIGYTGTALASVERIAGHAQSDTVRATLGTPLRVRLRDTDDLVVAGAFVRFAVVSRPAGDSLATLSDTLMFTNASGEAAATVTLGSRTGTYTVRANAVDADTLFQEFTLTAQPGRPVLLVQSFTSSLQDTVLQRLDPFVFTVTDSYGNGVSGVSVRYAITSSPAGASGQFLSDTLVVTDSAGQAGSRLTMGNRTGSYIVSVSVPAFGASRQLVCTALPSAAVAIARVAGSGQSNQILTLADSHFVARVADGFGNPVNNVPISFTIISVPTGASGHSLVAVSDTTDSLGHASTRLMLGNRTGLYLVEASSPVLPGLSTTFQVLATHGAAANLAASGPAIRDTVLKLSQPMTVTLVDAEGNAIPAAVVRYGLETPPGATGQFLTADTLLTDSTGSASVRLGFGSKVGTYTVTAVADLLPDSVRVFRATAVSARAALAERFEFPVAARPILTFLDTSFVVRVADAFGNPVMGVPVQFAVVDSPANATGHLISRTDHITNDAGVAWTNLKLGLKVGRYAVRADVNGLPSLTFSATALPGAPKVVAGLSPDSAGFVNAPVRPLEVTVTDTGGNAVPNRIVTFETTGAPAGATGYRLSSLTARTDSLGRAFTTLTLGSKSGAYVVTATVGNLPSAAIRVRARDVKGNPNLDDRIDVADLTAIIDHLLGRTPLAGASFDGADVDSNGVVDIRDAIITRNYILSGGSWVLADTSRIAIAQYPGGVRADDVSPAELRRTAASTPKPDYSGGSPINTRAQLEFTKLGVRVNLTNDVPVKGVQLYLRLKRSVAPPRGDVTFGRAAMMNVFAAGNAREVFALAYNLTNVPIDTGSGPIFRIPIGGLDTTDVDSVAIIVSSGTANVSTQVDDQRLAKEVVDLPVSYVLRQNYPNPFNTQTTIEYEVPELPGRLARVTIQVFNMLGQKVVTIDRGDKDAGTYRVLWNGRDEHGDALASGVYFYRLLSIDPENRDNFTSSRKMIYLK